MTVRVALIAALGVALAFYLVEYVGWQPVLRAAAAVGWTGLTLLCLYALLLSALFLGSAWRTLLPRSAGGAFGTLIWARIVRDSAAEVLPFTQLGGMALGVRAAVAQGIPTPLAVGSMIVDITTEIIAQVIFIGIGLYVLSIRAAVPIARPLAAMLAGGMILVAAGGVSFLIAQRYGKRWLARFAARHLPASLPMTAAVTSALDAIYESPGRIAISALFHLGGWVGSALGTWLALRFMGAELDPLAAVGIESLVCAIRSGAVVVPNALGIQEAAYSLLAPLFGVGKELGLAVSLVRRARDVAIGVPVLLIWQASESRRSLASGSERSP